MINPIKNIIIDVFSVLVECNYHEALSLRYKPKQIQSLCELVFYSDMWNALDRGLVLEAAIKLKITFSISFLCHRNKTFKFQDLPLINCCDCYTNIKIVCSLNFT